MRTQKKKKKKSKKRRATFLLFQTTSPTNCTKSNLLLHLTYLPYLTSTHILAFLSLSLPLVLVLLFRYQLLPLPLPLLVLLPLLPRLLRIETSPGASPAHSGSCTCEKLGCAQKMQRCREAGRLALYCLHSSMGLRRPGESGFSQWEQ